MRDLNHFLFLYANYTFCISFKEEREKNDNCIDSFFFFFVGFVTMKKYELFVVFRKKKKEGKNGTAQIRKRNAW